MTARPLPLLALGLAALVCDIQRKLEADVARPMLGWRNECFTHWPYVKNLVPHNSLYNYARMQEV